MRCEWKCASHHIIHPKRDVSPLQPARPTCKGFISRSRLVMWCDWKFVSHAITLFHPIEIWTIYYIWSAEKADARACTLSTLRFQTVQHWTGKTRWQELPFMLVNKDGTTRCHMIAPELQIHSIVSFHPKWEYKSFTRWSRWLYLWAKLRKSSKTAHKGQNCA